MPVTIVCQGSNKLAIRISLWSRWKKKKEIHDTKCPYWDQVSINNINQTNTVKSNFNHQLNIVPMAKWVQWSLSSMPTTNSEVLLGTGFESLWVKFRWQCQWCIWPCLIFDCVLPVDWVNRHNLLLTKHATCECLCCIFALPDHFLPKEIVFKWVLSRYYDTLGQEKSIMIPKLSNYPV